MNVQAKKNVGLIGCGNISSIYLESPRKFDILNIVACADIDMERAQTQAQKHSVPRVCSVEELLADPEIDIILNLTTPQAHTEIGLAAVRAGKSVYSEKPLGIRREEAGELLKEAEARNLRVGCAPDTFLGGGIQTCLKLINDGAIGVPVAATAFMACHGHENWHPNPDFYYQRGGGPLYDMGPYYLTTLVALLGPVRRVTGATRISFPERIITSQPRHDARIKVDTPTHVSALLDFVDGPVATMLMSFDMWSHHLPHIEVYGSEGSLSVPDPNTFHGPVYLWHAQTNSWQEVPLTHGYSENSRGIGLADMAHAMRSGHQHRANGQMAYHVLDIMQAIHEASASDKHIVLNSLCERPAPLTTGIYTWQEDH